MCVGPEVQERIAALRRRRAIEDHSGRGAGPSVALRQDQRCREQGEGDHRQASDGRQQGAAASPGEHRFYADLERGFQEIR